MLDMLEKRMLASAELGFPGRCSAFNSMGDGARLRLP
jgi:hypothetical protein